MSFPKARGFRLIELFGLRLLYLSSSSSVEFSNLGQKMISNFRIEIKKLLKIESDVNEGEKEEEFFPEDDGNNC